MDYFSLPQCIGYVAFIFGVTAFLQKDDARLKFLVGMQMLAYAIHFALLGSIPSVAGAVLTGARSFIAIRVSSPLVALVMIVGYIAAGVFLTGTNLTGWLPIIGSCVSAYAVFTMQGVTMRLAILFNTFCWLANNIIAGSIGGSILEATIAIINIYTILQLLKSSSHNNGELPVSGSALQQR